MPRLLFTCDVECHDPRRPENWLLGRTVDGSWLEWVARELQKRRIEGVFFVDFIGCEKWPKTLDRVLDILTECGQRVELHIHPSNAQQCQKKRLNELSQEWQATLFAEAIENYIRFIGKEPHCFRAGAYGLNRQTLALLSEYKLADSSYYPGKPQVEVTLPDYTEFQVAVWPITTLFLPFLHKHVKHDLNILPRSVLANQILANDVMFFLHSFSFNRFQGRVLTSEVNQRVVRRMNTILRAIDEGVVSPVRLDDFTGYLQTTGISLFDACTTVLYCFLRSHLGLLE